MDFIIKYSVFTIDGKLLKKNGEIRVKKKNNRFEAQVGLEKYLENKHKQKIKLIIHSCEDNIDDILNIFDTIFKGKV